VGSRSGGKTLVFTGISAAGCKTNIIAYTWFYWIAGALSCHKGHKMVVVYILVSPRLLRNDVSEVFELRHYAAVMRLEPPPRVRPRARYRRYRGDVIYTRTRVRDDGDGCCFYFRT
jgi:hypothetical protein